MRRSSHAVRGLNLGGLVFLALLSGCADGVCSNPTEDTLGELTAWERELLASGGVPESPAPEFLDAPDGLPLAHHDWAPGDWDGTGAAALVVPGSSAYGELYAVWGEELRARGVWTRIIDVRGHGRSVCDADGDCGRPPYPQPLDDGRYFVGRSGDALDEHQLVRDLAAHIADLRQRWPDATVALVGHSSGGGLISRYIETTGMSSVDTVVLVAPFNHYEQPQNVDAADELCEGTAGTRYAQLDLGALGDALRGNRHRYVLDLVKGPEKTAPLDTTRYTYTMMSGMGATAPETFLLAYTRPTLWIAAREDALLELAPSRDQFQRMPGGGRFVVVENTSHVGLSWSAEVASQIADWIVEAGRRGRRRD